MIQILYSVPGKIPEKLNIIPSVENFFKLVNGSFDLDHINIGKEIFYFYKKNANSKDEVNNLKKVFFRLEGGTEQSLSDIDMALLSGWLTAEGNGKDIIYNKVNVIREALENCSDEFGQCNCTVCSYKNSPNCFNSLYLDSMFIFGAYVNIRKLNGEDNIFIIKEAIEQCLQKKNCAVCPFNEYEYCGKNLRSNIQSFLFEFNSL